MVVVADVVAQARDQLLHAMKLDEVEELRLQCSEETFHRRIVEAIALSRHTLRDILRIKKLTVGARLKVPSGAR